MPVYLAGSSDSTSDLISTMALVHTNSRHPRWCPITTSIRASCVWCLRSPPSDRTETSFLLSIPHQKDELSDPETPLPLLRSRRNPRVLMRRACRGGQGAGYHGVACRRGCGSCWQGGCCLGRLWGRGCRCHVTCRGVADGARVGVGDRGFVLVVVTRLEPGMVRMVLIGLKVTYPFCALWIEVHSTVAWYKANSSAW
jgi:hypothetical protein